MSYYLTESINDIICEYEAALDKFPWPNNLIVALMEEVGEVARAYIEQRGKKEVYSEAKQVAALALRIMIEEDELYTLSKGMIGDKKSS